MSKDVGVEIVAARILVVRGKRVMADRDLAEMYGVETKQLVRQVKRNLERFPDDFMFQISSLEHSNLRCHFGTSSWGGRRFHPYVFTEQGIAMLSSVLNSQRAIQVNIAIMRAFVKLREVLLTHSELAAKLETLELKFKEHDGKFTELDKQIAVVFEAIKQLIAPPPLIAKPKIGFKP